MLHIQVYFIKYCGKATFLYTVFWVGLKFLTTTEAVIIVGVVYNTFKDVVNAN